MESSTEKRNRRRIPQSLSMVLLAVGVAGAGLAAFVTRGTNSVPEARRTVDTSDSGVEGSAPSVVPPGGGARRVLEAEAPAGSAAPPADPEQVSEIDVPSPEEALRLRRPKVEARRDIVERGIAALLEPPKCKAPAELSEAGRSGDGVYGCVIRAGGGALHVVGRAAHRKLSGNLEVGAYEDGERTGEWEQYYPTGVLAAEGSFTAGQRDGVWHEYDETGEHRISRTYEAGRKHGVAIRYLGDSPQVDLYFEGGQYDPESKEPVLRAEVAEAP